MAKFTVLVQNHPLGRVCVGHLPPLSELLDRQIKAQQGFTDLASNINPYGGCWREYPDQIRDSLLAQYCKILSEQSGDTVRPEEILFTRGSSEGIDLLIRAFCEPGVDTVAIPAPTFPLYSYFSMAANVSFQELGLVGENFDRLNVAQLVASKSRLAFLCQPNNPIGSALAEADFEALLEQYQGLVALDEAYCEYSSHQTWLRWRRRSENLVVLRTFSKAWGCAGLRVGAVIANPEIIEMLRRVQGPFAMPTPVFHELQKCIDTWPAVKRQAQQICLERERLQVELVELPAVRRVLPSQTNFLTVVFADADAAYRLLVQARFIVERVEKAVRGALRIAVSTSESNDRLLKTLRQLASPLEETESRQ